MVGSAISSAPDFLNNDWCVSGGSAVGPIEVNSPALHVRTDVTGCHAVVHWRDRVSIPPEIRQNGQHVAARSTRPGAHGCLRIGADDQIEGYQSRPEDLGSSDGGHRAGLPPRPWVERRWSSCGAPSDRQGRPGVRIGLTFQPYMYEIRPAYCLRHRCFAFIAETPDGLPASRAPALPPASPTWTDSHESVRWLSIRGCISTPPCLDSSSVTCDGMEKCDALSSPTPTPAASSPLG